MIKLKRHKILCLIASCLILNSSFAHATNYFSKSTYNIPEGKSIFFSPNYKKKFKLISETPSVVSIDNKGIAYAKSRGQAKIKLINKKGKNISECIIEVRKKDPFRIVYPSKNHLGANENFKINAVTYKNVELVKFEVSGEGFSKTIECHAKSDYLDYYRWKHSIKLPHKGSYHIKAYAKIGKSWKTCDEANSDVFVSEKYDRKKSSLAEKTVSRKCSDMIAAWEGSCSHAYKDVAGNLTIGYGKRIYPYEVFYNHLTSDEMSNMFLQTLNNSGYTKNVNKFLIENKIKFNQQQFDALVSFSYNLGCGWMYSNSELSKIILDCAKGKKTSNCGIVNSSNGLWVRSQPSTSSKKLLALRNGERVDITDSKKVNGKWYKIRTKDGINGYCYGDYIELVKISKGVKNLKSIDKNRFAKEFLAYHHAGGKCNKGLFKRRVEELNIFFNGQYKRFYNLKKSDIPYPIPECAKNALKIYN